jgi:hypothetical protein
VWCLINYKDVFAFTFTLDLLGSVGRLLTLTWSVVVPLARLLRLLGAETETPAVSMSVHVRRVMTSDLITRCQESNKHGWITTSLNLFPLVVLWKTLRGVSSFIIKSLRVTEKLLNWVRLGLHNFLYRGTRGVCFRKSDESI